MRIKTTVRKFTWSASLIFVLTFLGAITTFGGPQLWTNWFREIDATQGHTLGCEKGEKYGYEYTVKNYIYKNYNHICKGKIISGQQITVYYVKVNPSLSWNISPKEVIFESFFAALIMSVLGATFSWNKIWGAPPKSDR